MQWPLAAKRLMDYETSMIRLLKSSRIEQPDHLQLLQNIIKSREGNPSTDVAFGKWWTAIRSADLPLMEGPPGSMSIAGTTKSKGC